jgi:hypothetical protein
MKWLADNYKWLFDGIGVLAAVGASGGVLRSEITTRYSVRRRTDGSTRGNRYQRAFCEAEILARAAALIFRGTETRVLFVPLNALIAESASAAVPAPRFAVPVTLEQFLPS